MRWPLFPWRPGLMMLVCVSTLKPEPPAGSCGKTRTRPIESRVGTKPVQVLTVFGLSMKALGFHILNMSALKIVDFKVIQHHIWIAYYIILALFLEQGKILLLILHPYLHPLFSPISVVFLYLQSCLKLSYSNIPHLSQPPPSHHPWAPVSVHPTEMETKPNEPENDGWSWSEKG